MRVDVGVTPIRAMVHATVDLNNPKRATVCGISPVSRSLTRSRTASVAGSFPRGVEIRDLGTAVQPFQPVADERRRAGRPLTCVPGSLAHVGEAAGPGRRGVTRPGGCGSTPGISWVGGRPGRAEALTEVGLDPQVVAQPQPQLLFRKPRLRPVSARQLRGRAEARRGSRRDAPRPAPAAAPAADTVRLDAVRAAAQSARRGRREPRRRQAGRRRHEPQTERGSHVRQGDQLAIDHGQDPIDHVGSRRHLPGRDRREHAYADRPSAHAQTFGTARPMLGRVTSSSAASCSKPCARTARQVPARTPGRC